jgi:hypothetical protein
MFRGGFDGGVRGARRALGLKFARGCTDGERYDRSWGPEPAILGTVCSMSSESTARKVRVAKYIARHAP